MGGALSAIFMPSMRIMYATKSATSLSLNGYTSPQKSSNAYVSTWLTAVALAVEVPEPVCELEAEAVARAVAILVSKAAACQITAFLTSVIDKHIPNTSMPMFKM